MNWLAITLLRLLGYLPLGILYGLSRLVRWVLESVLTYRMEVVHNNLQRSFPNKTEQEIADISHDFYRFLADMIVESIKLQSISKAELMNRCQFENPEVLRAYESNGKNVIIMMGHSGNWEWAGAATALHFKFHMFPVYRRVKNSAFDRFFIRLRGRFDSTPVLDTEAFQFLQSAPQPHAVAMLADQTPGRLKGWWTEFLHQPTPFFRGSELMANRLGYDVVFAHVRMVSRGRYSIWLENYKAQSSERFELTKSFASFLEREIEKQPENWLWSHNRWKHKANDDSVWMS